MKMLINRCQWSYWVNGDDDDQNKHKKTVIYCTWMIQWFYSCEAGFMTLRPGEYRSILWTILENAYGWEIKDIEYYQFKPIKTAKCQG